MLIALCWLMVADPSALLLHSDAGPAVSLTLAELQALPATTADWQHHGETHSVKGVPLLALLQRVGWAPGPAGKGVKPEEKHSGARFVAVATARDGYQAVLSAGELTDGKTVAIVAWAIDGQPLPGDMGPLRLIVPTDGEMARSIFQVAKIDLVDMRRIVH